MSLALSPLAVLLTLILILGLWPGLEFNLVFFEGSGKPGIGVTRRPMPVGSSWFEMNFGFGGMEWVRNAPAEQHHLSGGDGFHGAFAKPKLFWVGGWSSNGGTWINIGLFP